MKNPLRSPKLFISLAIVHFSHFPILSIIKAIVVLIPFVFINETELFDARAQTPKLRIGIESGHNLTDGAPFCAENGPGNEATINIAVAKKLKQELEARGYEVDLFHNHEPGALPKDRIYGYSADAFIALHSEWCACLREDSAGECVEEWTGFKVSRYGGNVGSGRNGSGDSSDRLVDALWSEYEKATGLTPNTGTGGFTFCLTHYWALNPIPNGQIGIRPPGSQCILTPGRAAITANTPGAVIEMGWLSGDFEFITSEEGQIKMAQGIANGITNFLSYGSSSSITDTVLVIDVSGSMNDVTQEGRKIDAARSAATNIVNMIKQDAQSSSGTASHRAGLVTFTTDAYLDHALANDFDILLTTIGGITPLHNTNIGAGLEVANQALTQASPQVQKIIILLSDGMSNTGLSRDGIIAGPVQDAINAGTCIYTVGFGDPGNLDVDLLDQIADASGCGDYYPAASVSQLEFLYTRIRHVSTGNLLAEFSGTVSQGETVQAGEFDVPAGLGELAASLVWPGSMLDLQLIDPSGTLVDMNYPSTNINSYSKLIYALIQNPKAGTWRLGVYGRDIPQVTTSFNALVSGRGNAVVVPSPTFSTGPVIVLVLLTIAGGGVAVYSTKLRRRKKGSAHPITRTVGGMHQLVFSQGALAGRSITIPESGLTIGRSSGCSLIISDPAVSRKHARLVMANGEWFIQDLGSSGGTYVNGQRVSAAPVKSGDVIQIGTNIFMVR
jgi:Mg-chelatase subunit ChlD